MVDWASRIIVMEEYHRRLIARYFKNADGRLQLISEFSADRKVPREIHDPYGEMKSYYRKTFLEIRRCLVGLFAKLSDV
jgi:protein-tyrosine-phosphatase